MPFLGIKMFRSLQAPKSGSIVEAENSEPASIAKLRNGSPTRESSQKQVPDVAAIVFRSPPLETQCVWRGSLCIT